MKGLCLNLITDELHRVPEAFQKRPMDTIAKLEQKTRRISARERRDYNREFCFKKHFHQLPLEDFSIFSFDELCKLKYSTISMMSGSVTNLFEDSPSHELVRKVESSMWRWGMGDGVWNEVADAYNGIRNFSLGDLSGFELRLDHTTGYNPRGWSKHSRTFLDGVFGLLVYYKGAHVLTLGFSIMRGRRILLQQVQSAKASANRALYRLPENRMEWAISLFLQNFPGYDISVIDGTSLADHVIAEYESIVEKAEIQIVKYTDWAKTSENERERSQYEDAVVNSVKERDEFKKRLVHLVSDRERVVAFYQNTGRYTRCSNARIVNGFAHFDVQKC